MRDKSTFLLIIMQPLHHVPFQIRQKRTYCFATVLADAVVVVVVAVAAADAAAPDDVVAAIQLC